MTKKTTRHTDSFDPFAQIIAEQKRQLIKWGVQNHENLHWLGIVVEELGEVSKKLIEGKTGEMERELVQLAACSIAWLECIERNKQPPRLP